MIAAIATGHVDLADVLFLIAFVLFVGAFVVRVMARSAIDVIASTAAAALVALAFFVL